MGTAPRMASPASVPVSLNPPPCETPGQKAALEESSGFELIGALREAAVSGAHSADSVFEAVASATRVLSGADGTALALQSRGTIVCRARSGSMAPELGTPISTDSGISGECLRTGTMLVCHDALSDPRVDNEVCSSLGIRSVVAVPVPGTLGVAGILEAFSSRPNAFDGDALSSLRALAEVAGTAYDRDVPAPAFVVRPMASIPRPTAYTTPPLAADEILGDVPPGKGRLWMIVGIAVALLATVAVAWWSWESSAEESEGSVQTVRAAAPDQPRAAIPHESTPKPFAGMLRHHSGNPRPEIVLRNAADLNRIEPTMGSTTGPSSSENALAKSSTEPEVAEVEAPNIKVTEVANPAELAGLTSVPVQMPSPAVRISEGVVEPALIHKVEPIYPMQARTQRLSGKVTVSATIAADGSVSDVAIVSGSSILAAAAQAAVRQWRYRPATLNGNPVEVQKEITFVFQP